MRIHAPSRGYNEATVPRSFHPTFQRIKRFTVNEQAHILEVQSPSQHVLQKLFLLDTQQFTFQHQPRWSRQFLKGCPSSTLTLDAGGKRRTTVDITLDANPALLERHFPQTLRRNDDKKIMQ